ncbi:hypothetical protein EVAR_11771_1 [Eumeta japonica]|uniref:Uncharacterized protein n=1 Tax=Eumeta variegata TaxID=151549 RepID=A0A4C1UPB5_EUMVA|nr:hypothetical protein EVAR_11771_1 [Eumeta japonica]
MRRLIRSASTSVRPPAVGCVYGLFRASSRPRTLPLHNRCPHPTLSACAVTRAAVVQRRHRIDTTTRAREKKSGRQARSVRSTPTRVTDACRLDPVGVHQRPTTGGRLRVQLELCLPSSSTNLRRSPPPAGACAMTARARVWVGDWAPARCQSMDPKTDHCHLSRRGRVPDEKTPGHEAKYKSSVPYLHPI